jgi:hypothetical protein
MSGARKCVKHDNSWRAQVSYLAASADLALMAGDNTNALDAIAAMETLTNGKERAAPDVGLVLKLLVYRTLHVRNAESACSMAAAAADTFRGRNPLYYAQVLGAYAWAQAQAFGQPDSSTAQDLSVYDELGLLGLKAALSAQGFLTCSRSAPYS